MVHNLAGYLREHSICNKKITILAQTEVVPLYKEKVTNPCLTLNSVGLV